MLMVQRPNKRGGVCIAINYRLQIAFDLPIGVPHLPSDFLDFPLQSVVCISVKGDSVEVRANIDSASL